MDTDWLPWVVVRSTLLCRRLNGREKALAEAGVGKGTRVAPSPQT